MKPEFIYVWSIPLLLAAIAAFDPQISQLKHQRQSYFKKWIMRWLLLSPIALTYFYLALPAINRSLLPAFLLLCILNPHLLNKLRLMLRPAPKAPAWAVSKPTSQEAASMRLNRRTGFVSTIMLSLGIVFCGMQNFDFPEVFYEREAANFDYREEILFHPDSNIPAWDALSAARKSLLKADFKNADVGAFTLIQQKVAEGPSSFVSVAPVEFESSVSPQSLCGFVQIESLAKLTSSEDAQADSVIAHLSFQRGFNYRPSASGRRNLHRHLYTHGLWQYSICKPHLELDNGGHPYWIVELNAPKGLLGSKLEIQYAVVNPYSGEFNVYYWHQIPEWVDCPLTCDSIARIQRDFFRDKLHASLISTQSSAARLNEHTGRIEIVTVSHFVDGDGAKKLFVISRSNGHKFLTSAAMPADLGVPLFSSNR